MDTKDLELDDIIQKVLKHKLKQYIMGKVHSTILATHEKLNNKKKLKEEAPTNVMGTSTSTAGSGPIATFDPILFQKKKKLIKRKVMES